METQFTQIKQINEQFPAAGRCKRHYSAGLDAGFLAAAGGVRKPRGKSDDYLCGYWIGVLLAEAYWAGWDGFFNGLCMPRSCPDQPEIEDFWKQGFEAAFLAAEEL